MLDFVPPIAWVAAMATVFVGSAVQGVLGLGLAIVSVPILTLISPTFVPVPVQLVALVMTVSQLVRERADLDVRGATWVLVGRVPGAAIGITALSLMTVRSLELVVGLVVLFGVAATAFGWTVPVTRTSQMVTGVLSGAMGLSTGVGGPPLAMLYRTRSGPEVRSTLGAVFTIGLLINLATLWVAGRIGSRELAIAAVLALPLVAGFAVSGTLARRLPPQVLRVGILVISAVAATALLVSVALAG